MKSLLLSGCRSMTMCLPNSTCSLAFKPDSRALNEQKTQQKPCLKCSRRMSWAGIMFKDIRLFFRVCLLSRIWKDSDGRELNLGPKWIRSSVIFSCYRRRGVYCYMCWQWPRTGAGKAPSFTLVRIERQFSTAVLWLFLFFFKSHLVENKDKLGVQRLFRCPGLQCGNKTRDGSREYSWEWQPEPAGETGWDWVRTRKTTISSSCQWWACLDQAHLLFVLFLTVLLLEDSWILFKMIVLSVIKSPVCLIS